MPLTCKKSTMKSEMERIKSWLNKESYTRKEVEDIIDLCLIQFEKEKELECINQ